eukprot:357713-Chlamydomonas_euryale.AAC.25
MGYGLGVLGACSPGRPTLHNPVDNGSGSDQPARRHPGKPSIPPSVRLAGAAPTDPTPRPAVPA